MPRVHLKKNDLVYVMSGKDKGKTGKVLKVFPDKNRAVVEGINNIHKHTRPNPQKKTLKAESSPRNPQFICPT